MERSYNFVDPTKNKKLPRWKLELEAKIHHDDNVLNYPELVHVPFEVTPEAIDGIESYQPHESIVHFTVPNSNPVKSQRLIFYDQKWLALEEQHLEGFRKHLKDKNLTLPEWYPEEEIVRLLHASNWDYNRTWTDINVIITWRAANLPIKLEDAHARLLKSGFFMVHGRDKYHRPIMICRPLVLLRMGLPNIEDIRRACAFTQFYMFNYMHLDGKVENNIFIFDLEKASPFGLPVKAMAQVEDLLKAQFKCKTTKVYVVNCSNTFVYGWAAIKGFLDPLVAQKVALFGDNTCQELLDLCEPDQLLEMYGGKAQMPSVFWPPTIPIKQKPEDKNKDPVQAFSDDVESDLEINDETHSIAVP